MRGQAKKRRVASSNVWKHSPRCNHVSALEQQKKDSHDAAPGTVRSALVSLLIVGACSGGGNPDSGTSTSPPVRSAQPQQGAQATEPGHSTQATLYWDPVTKPPVDGYRVHYGTQSGMYIAHVNTGNVTSWTVRNLQPGTYYFSVTAIKAGHKESGYSNEVSITIKGGHGG